MVNNAKKEQVDPRCWKCGCENIYSYCSHCTEDRSKNTTGIYFDETQATNYFREKRTPPEKEIYNIYNSSHEVYRLLDIEKFKRGLFELEPKLSISITQIRFTCINSSGVELRLYYESGGVEYTCCHRCEEDTTLLQDKILQDFKRYIKEDVKKREGSGD